MNISFRSILIFTFILLISSCQKSEFDFYDLEGNGYRYSDLEGRFQIVNYWAIWCAPCKHEIPELQALHDDYDNVAVFGVNFDQPELDVMSEQAKLMNIGFPTYRRDPSSDFGIKTPEVLPTTLVFSPNREMLATLVGPQTKESLLSIIEEN
jgi:thiol-disulfide isomerase/thioredoxin|tara:strand:+ start:1204 stop:1659 length:456 start_codon:yes stop_codon:yes gene_type:complete